MSARFEVLPRAMQRVMPWQNGGGTTRQVAIDPPDGSLATGFRWRISVAHVAKGGPFSHLPGVDRSLWLVRGNGMRLTLPDREVVLEQPFARLDFAGETRIEAALLDGPCEDCNVMTRRADVSANARIVSLRDGERLRLEPAPQQILLVLEGALRVREPALGLDEGDALRCDEVGCEVSAERTANVLVATFAASAAAR